MKKASDILIHEHDVIERVLIILNIAADRLENGEEISGETFLQCVDFIRNFADHCHHAKEEKILFRLMEERGIPVEGGPIGMMLTEHENGRAFTRGMEEAAKRFIAGDISAKDDIIANARHYSELLSNHIYKENNILYPMGDRLFTSEDQHYLEKEFERVEKEVGGLAVHEKYHRWVNELESLFHLEKNTNN